jgi:xylan 1,4-beta-xylosidase
MYWAISDVFEESGPGEGPFSGKYGLLNLHGIKKPVYHAFQFFSQLYDEVLETGDSTYVTRSSTGALRVLSWNYNEAEAVDFSGGDYETDPVAKQETIRVNSMRGRYRVRGWRVDRESGNAYRAWQEMECPEYLTEAQVDILKQAAEPVLFTEQIIECEGAFIFNHILRPSGMVFYDIEKIS